MDADTTAGHNTMKYSDIVSYPRTWNKATHPAVAHIEIPAEDFREVERLIGDQTQTKILGHDLGDDDHVIIHVACTTDAVKRRLESRWA
jgi:hypothetical protein